MGGHIKINYKTINAEQQRELIETTKELCKALNSEDYIEIIKVYGKVLDRLISEAEKQGIEV